MKTNRNEETINKRELAYIEDHQIDIDKKKKKIENDIHVDESVKMYLKEIGKYPLIEDQNEVVKYATLVDSQHRKKLLKQIKKDSSIVNNLDISLLFNSLCDNKDYENIINSILDTYSILSCDIPDGKILFKYLQETKKVNRALNKDELKKIFNIDTNKKLNELELYKELKKYLNYRIGFDKLFVSNLRLVVSIASKYAHRSKIDLNELINEGNMGLIRAIDEYNESLGFRFSTYATYKIRQPIVRAIANYGRYIRLPASVIDELNKFKFQVNLLEQEEGKILSSNEIAYLLAKKEIEECKKILTKEEKQKIIDSKKEAVDKYFELLTDPLYLDQMINEEEDTSLGDIIPSRVDVEEEILKRALKEEIEEIFNILTPKEILILKMYWGICEYNGMNYSIYDIARIMKTSPVAIEKIETKARNKIKFFIKRNEKVKALSIYN